MPKQDGTVKREIRFTDNIATYLGAAQEGHDMRASQPYFVIHELQVAHDNG